MQDQILGKQVPNTQEGLWSINNQNYLLPDLLQQSQIKDSSVSPPQVPLTCQEPQNKPLTKVRDKLQIDWIELQPFSVSLSFLFLRWAFSLHLFFPLHFLSGRKIRNLELSYRFHCYTSSPPSPYLLSLLAYFFSPFAQARGLTPSAPCPGRILVCLCSYPWLSHT